MHIVQCVFEWHARTPLAFSEKPCSSNIYRCIFLYILKLLTCVLHYNVEHIFGLMMGHKNGD